MEERKRPSIPAQRPACSCPMEEAVGSAVAPAVERFAAAHIGTVTPAASPALSSFSSSTPTTCDISCRVHVKARWMTRMLAWVRATLDDAEEMNIMDASIRDWLRELQEVADATEDLLDEFPHEASRLGFVGDGVWAAGSIGGLPRQGKMTSEMARLHDQRMEDIVSRFMKINKPEQALKLDYLEEQMDAESIYARRTTSPVMEEPHIVGRIEELAKIKQFLLSSDAEESGVSDSIYDIPVMAIVGMGGLGKTTLAQLAYNDAQVNKHFQLKSWVCVSEDFDVIRLTKAILQSLDVEANGLTELDPLQRKLVQKLNGEDRFLLVLDDVWEAETLNIHCWNILIAPFYNIFPKIIVTTRSRKVSEMAPITSTYDLGFLSDEDTLELFMWHAFEGRHPLYRNLVAIGKETARKCRGVPLAAKTVGGLLHNKDDDEWNKILESEVWNATINQEDSIIPILKLSYQHLTAPLKRCFRYCSLFAKDCVFDRNQLIRMWMAQGYIKANRRELMEDIGQRYIDNLLSRSFFQNCPWNPEGLQMHDLMHDLARCVSGGECYSMEGGKSCLVPSNVRHLSIFPTGDPRGTIISSRKDISEPKSFRSFLLPDEKLCYLISHDELLSDLYTSMEHLRVLDLGGVRLYGLPKSIAHLKHLRYLRISGFFKELPKFVGSMYHLQTLDLGGVSELPNNMSNLLNLRHLRSRDIIDYPVGIGKLVDLQRMPGFHVSPKYNHAKLGELKDMNNIRGVFAISGLENLADVNEAKKACLGKKRNISSLRLEWDPRAASSSIDDEVLVSLKPSIKLASLQISGFKGLCYPSWLVDRSFSRLGTLELVRCENWIFLPPLGQLPSLKSLYISKARSVEYIGSEFFSGGFPQLEELTLRSLYNWKSWCVAQNGECSKLKKLSIERCRNLESFSLINLHALEDISICRCPKLRCVPGHSLDLSHLPCVKTIKIQEVYKVRLTEASHFSTAAPLDDQPCLKLEDVGQREAEYMLGMCSYICQLTVRRCLNLMSLPLGNQSALEYLTITECPDLRITSISPQLWQLPSLKKMFMNRIHGVGCITVLFEKSHLGLENVDQLVVSFLLKEFSHMIHRLVITNCVNLTSLPLVELTALEQLEISGCNQLQLSSGSLQLPQSSSMQKMTVQYIRGAEYIRVLFSPGSTETLETSCLEFTNVDQLEASFLLCEFSHMIHRLTVTGCTNLTSLPLAELTTVEYLEISRCSQLQLSSGSLPRSSSMREMTVQYIRGAEYIHVLFSPGSTETRETSCLEFTNVDQLEASFLLCEFSHMIRRLTVSGCENLTSLPLAELTTMEYLEISRCNQLQLSSGSLPQSSSMREMTVKYIRGAEYIHGLFSPGGTDAKETCFELANVNQLEVSYLLCEFSHMTRRLSITGCSNLTSLPWTELTTLEYLAISECPLFNLLDAEQLPPALQVLCIYGNPYEREQCSRHQYFQRLKQVQQCSNKQGGDCNLYLVFRNVYDVSEAANNFCHDARKAANNFHSKIYREIHTWEIEWDCCTNDGSNFVDSVGEEVIGKLSNSVGTLWNIRLLNKLVIRGYMGSRFASSRWHPFLYSLSSVSLLHCSKCEILPQLSQLNSLEELFVKGASSLESCMQDPDAMSEEGWQKAQTRIAFPRLHKLEFHDMPVWKEWWGTKEGDFPLLRKLILKHCPKLRALPHLPPSLEELELEACHELTSLSLSDTPDHAKSLLPLNPLRWLSLSETKGTTPILQRMSLTDCPQLLIWCEGHSRILEGIPTLSIDGVRVHTRHGKSIMSQIKFIFRMVGFPMYDED